MFSLICARINGSANNVDAGDLRRYLAHYDVIVMGWLYSGSNNGHQATPHIHTRMIRMYIHVMRKLILKKSTE